MRSVYAKILDAIRANGPLSSIEVSREVEWPTRSVRAMISRHKNLGRIHIGGWRRDSDGGYMTLRALYKFGPGTDVKSPSPITSKVAKRRHREKKKLTSRRVASVFDLGMMIGAASAQAK